MSAQIDPQEIYLLERYVSTEYFGELRDTWAAMVKHVESCLESFMRVIPADYRSRQLSEQPDVVWGEHVLPNYRETLQGLIVGYILLSHGDLKGFDYACGPLSDFRGQLEFGSHWMSDADETHYADLLHKAVMLSFNISTTVDAGWDPTDLSIRYDLKERGDLDRPPQWPVYRVNQNVSVASGGQVVKAGIYVPRLDSSCAEFLSPAMDEAPLAKVLVEVRDLTEKASGEKYDEELVIDTLSCVWQLVERSSVVDEEVPTMIPDDANRTAAGEQCSQAGYYFTPARPNSRRYFGKGEHMPEFDTSYGTTIWQWDKDQTHARKK